MSFNYTDIKPALGEKGYGVKIRALYDRVQDDLNSIQTGGGLASDSVQEYHLAFDNNMSGSHGVACYHSSGGQLKMTWNEKLDTSYLRMTVDPATGDFFVAGTSGYITPQSKTTENQIGDNTISEVKLKITNDPSTTQINFVTCDTSGNLNHLQNIPDSAFSAGTIDYTKLRMIGTPQIGYFQKFGLDTSGNLCLVAAPSANTEDSGMIRRTEGSAYEWIGEYLTSELPGQIPNYNNLNNIGKVQEESGGEFLYPSQMSFTYKIHDVNGAPVEATSASFHGKTLTSPTSGQYQTFNEWQTSGNYNGRIRRDSSAGLQYINEYLLASFKESGPVTVFDNTTSVSIGIRSDVSFLIDKTFNAAVLVGVKAQTYLKGVTGSTTIMLLRRRLSETLGDSTTRFDVTRPGTPNANTTRFTYDGTGTNPNISDADASLRAGDYMMIYGSNFSAKNKGVYKLTAVGSNYFEVTNSAGVAEADKTIGTGYMIPIKMMLSTSLSIDDAFDSESCVIYAETTRKTLQTGDLIIPEILSVHSTPPVGLCLAYRFGGINEAD